MERGQEPLSLAAHVRLGELPVVGEGVAVSHPGPAQPSGELVESEVDRPVGAAGSSRSAASPPETVPRGIGLGDVQDETGMNTGVGRRE